MKKYLILIILLLAVLIFLFREQPLPAQWQAWAGLVEEQAVPEQFAEEFCRENQSRLFGSTGEGQAADYLLTKLQQWAPAVVVDSFEYDSWQRGSCDVEILSPVQKKLPALALGKTPEFYEGQAELVYAGYGYPAELEKISDQITGKWAYIRSGTPAGQKAFHLSGRIELLTRHGAAGVVVKSMSSDERPTTGTATMDRSIAIPSLIVSVSAANMLDSLIAAGAAPRIHVRMTNTTSLALSRNIICELPGEVPDTVVVAGAHYDSWDLSAGVLDNGTSVAVLYETARMLAASGFRPRYTIQFVFFAAEEAGMYGSRHFVQQKLASGKTIRAMVNLEMLSLPQGINIMPRLQSEKLFRELMRELNSLGVQPLVKSDNWINSDHLPFLLAGIPAINIISDLPPESEHHYHSYRDGFDLIPKLGLKTGVTVCGILIQQISKDNHFKLESTDPAQVRKMILEHHPCEEYTLSDW